MTAPSPERARLAAVLRELKGRTGLSLAGLAAKTAFSKSSWDRYLNGRTLPQRDAVQELCRLAGEPEGRCLALWEIAESEGSGRAAAQPPEEAAPVEDAGRRGSADQSAVHRRATLVAVLAAVSAV
ncbi:helix-turn-helix transcriptional regulator, partial [Streptomyces sp. Lzd4kr]|nr:helix-turn-helix transcriptional regulator [Streptomyces sp. Lzd4kr]